MRRGIGMSSHEGYFDNGISVCKRWLRYSNFLKDMGEAPAYTSLDRINVKRGYCPSNCRWACSRVQASNKRKTRYVQYKGKKTSLRDFADAIDKPLSVVSAWYGKGLSVSEMLKQPYVSRHQQYLDSHGLKAISVVRILDWLIDCADAAKNPVSRIMLGRNQLKAFSKGTKEIEFFPSKLRYYRNVKVDAAANDDIIYVNYENRTTSSVLKQATEVLQLNDL